MANRPTGKQSADRRAEASLRKHGIIWWTHFGFKGQFFCRSLLTSDRTKAKREAKKLIALAEAGKIQARTSSPAERAAQRSSSLKKSHADPKMHAADVRRATKRWAEADTEQRRRHREGIKNALSPDDVRERMSDRSKKTWQRPGYRKRNTRAVRKGWAPKSKRKRQSKRLKAACARPEVKASRLAGRLRGAAAFLERHVHPNAQDAASAPTPAKTRRRRKPKPQNQKEQSRIASKVEQRIGSGPRSKNAIVAARFAVSAEEDLEYDTVAQYHRRYMHVATLRAATGPTQYELINLYGVSGTD